MAENPSDRPHDVTWIQPLRWLEHLRDKDSDLWFRPLDGAGTVRLSRNDIVRQIPVFEEFQCPNIETSKLAQADGEPIKRRRQVRRYFHTRDNRWILSLHPYTERDLIEVTRSAVVQDLSENGISIPAELNSPDRPRWDSDSRTLSVDRITCRHYTRRNADNQFTLLDAFENAGWPRSVDSPFKRERTLRDTTDELNGNLAPDSPIRFGVEERKPIWFRS
jgi:hypothetical protein